MSPPSQVQAQVGSLQSLPSLTPCPRGAVPDTTQLLAREEVLLYPDGPVFSFQLRRFSSAFNRKHHCFLVTVFLEFPEYQSLKKKKNHVGLSSIPEASQACAKPRAGCPGAGSWEGARVPPRAGCVSLRCKQGYVRTGEILAPFPISKSDRIWNSDGSPLPHSMALTSPCTGW